MSAPPPSSEPAPLGRVEWIALVLVTVAALVLRCVGIDRMLPHFLEPDLFVVNHAQDMRGDPDRLPIAEFRERYPSQIARAASFLPRGPVPASVEPGEDALAVHLHAASVPYEQVRALSAIVSALLVPLTYLLARRFFARRGALVAAALVATSLLHISHAMQARPHGIQATLALAAVLAAARAVRVPGWKPLALACLAAAAAVGALQTGMFVLPPLVVACVARASSWRRGALVAALCIAVVLAAAAPFYPAWIRVDEGGLRLAGAGGHTLYFSQFNGRGFVNTFEHLWAYDPLLLVVALIGAVLWVGQLASGGRAALRARIADRTCWVIASYVVPFGIVIGLNEETYDRFILPLLPYIACAASLAVVTAARATCARAGAAVETLVAAGFCALLAVPAVLLARLNARPDTLERTAEWLQGGWRADAGNRDPASVPILTTAPLVLPVWSDPTVDDVVGETYATGAWPWLQYQHLLGRDAPRERAYALRMIPLEIVFHTGETGNAELARWFEKWRPGYVIVELYPRTVGWPMTWRLRELARERGDLVWQTEGETHAWRSLGAIGYQGNRELPIRLLFADALGPAIEVYRIRP